MTWGFFNLHADFKYQWYYPRSSYYVDFIEKSDTYFKTNIEITMFVTGGNIYDQRDDIRTLYQTLSNNSGVDYRHFYCWYEEYLNWPQKLNNPTEQEFYDDVSRFLNSISGFIFAPEVFFIADGKNITGFKLRLLHREKRSNTWENLAIKKSIYKDIDQLNLSSRVSVISLDYFYLDVVDITNHEFYRNIGISLAGVLFMVLPTLGSIQLGFWVSVGVVFTVMGVTGTTYYAGFYIDPFGMVATLLAIGVSVDYMVHIGHKFMMLSGTRILRMRQTISTIGPAVFNGAFSTFIAVILLIGTDSYIYQIFFTLTSTFVAFGIWNSILFLPSVLGSIGPEPHATAVKAVLSKRAKIRNT